MNKQDAKRKRELLKEIEIYVKNNHRDISCPPDFEFWDRVYGEINKIDERNRKETISIQNIKKLLINAYNAGFNDASSIKYNDQVINRDEYINRVLKKNGL